MCAFACGDQVLDIEWVQNCTSYHVGLQQNTDDEIHVLVECVCVRVREGESMCVCVCVMQTNPG